MGKELIEIEVRKPLEWSRVLKIKVSPERIESQREKIARSLRKKARIPGFRHGKAPISLVNQRYGSEIEGETIEAVINRAVEEAMKKEDLSPITRASIDNIQYEDESLAFEASFDIRPEIVIERYTSFNLDREKVTVNKDEVEASIENLLTQKATYHEADRAAEKGDLLKIDYTPVDDKMEPLVKQKVEDVGLILGDNKILPDMEAQLYGKRAGDDLPVQVIYPEDYHRDELKGEKKDFKVLIRSVAERKVPELNEEFVKSIGDFSDIESFKTFVRGEILRQKERDIDKKLEEALIDNIIDANSFEVPDSMVKSYMSEIVKNFEVPDSQSRESLEIDEKVRPIAEREVKKGFIIDFILKKENLEPDSSEVEKELERLARELKKDPGELKTAVMANPENYNGVRQRLGRKKVFEFLKKNSEITPD